MSTSNKSKKHFFSQMWVRLWFIMMAVVLFTIVLMWIVQVFVLESNYADMAVGEIKNQLETVREELTTGDLADNGELLSYLSKIINGKLMLVDKNGSLIEIYSYGHTLNMEEDMSNVSVWEDIENSDVYENVLARQTYSREVRENSHLESYEIGLPAVYNGEEVYLILRQSFSELNQVLGMNRRQLIAFSILLTLVSAVIAAVLSRRFIKPVRIIKDTVDELARGNLEAEPDIALHDEVGQLAESVRELGQALQRVDALRKELIANVSHELRSPLSLIGGYAEMVRDIHWKDEEKRQEDLNLIIKEANRMSEMVSDILDYSQLQAGYLQLRKDWYNLCEILESEIMLCEQSVVKNHIKITLSLPQGEAMAYVDALKISQVIRNLLYNAINHTQDGESIVAELKEEQEGFYVAVKNVGDPIPEEERSLIWERYHRSQHQGGRNEGTGLGLSIVSTILKAHGMDYGVDYEDKMTVFWFRYRKKQDV